MMLKTDSKRGRPKKFDSFVYFGMKLTLEDKNKIKFLAKEKHTSASSIIMDLVNKEINKSNFSSNGTPKPTEFLKMNIEERKKIIQAQLLSCSNVYDFIEDEQEYIEYE